LLDRHRLGLVLGNHFAEPGADLENSLGQRQLDCRADHAAFAQDGAAG